MTGGLRGRKWTLTSVKFLMEKSDKVPDDEYMIVAYRYHIKGPEIKKKEAEKQTHQ